MGRKSMAGKTSHMCTSGENIKKGNNLFGLISYLNQFTFA